ncbi:RDD family protein [bacterium]|nr:RDD family protein [bacterium]
MTSAAEFLEDYEVLTVETPENIELRLPLAGFGPRFLAQLIDGLIQGSIAFILVLIVIIFSSFGMVVDPGTGATVMLILVLLAIILTTLGYYVIFETIWNGQTPGKRVTGIRVVKRGGLPLTFTDALLRNLIRIVDNLPSYGLVGLISFFSTRNQQRLGDLVADTVVVREFTRGVPFSWGGREIAISEGSAAIPPALSYVMSAYLFRSNSLPVEERLRLTARIIRRLGYDPTQMSLHERDEYLASLLNWQAAGAR